MRDAAETATLDPISSRHLRQVRTLRPSPARTSAARGEEIDWRREENRRPHVVPGLGERDRRDRQDDGDEDDSRRADESVDA